MKLLERTVRVYLLYSLLIVLVAIPAFYVIIHEMFMQDVNHVLKQRRDELVAKLNAYPGESSWAFLQAMDENIVIRPLKPNSSTRQRFFNRKQYDAKAGEVEPLRLLSSVAMIHGKPYRIILRQSLIDSEDLSEGILVTQAILLVALLAGLLLINRYQSAKIWHPFYGALRQLRAYDLDKDPRLELESGKIREFQDLNQAILQLVQKNHQVYQNQKGFIENAAHEMQTPLAIFRGKLDLLLQHKSLDQEQAEQIQSISETLDRLQRLNKSLLLISKIENRQFLEKSLVNMGTAGERALEQASDLVQEMQIQVTSELDPATVVAVNPALADILISNLVTNAVIHNVSRGILRLSIRDHTLKVENTGPDLPFDPSRIFDRFQKNPANARSTGLGLAIVKQICEVSGFRINYAFRLPERVHEMTVFFSGQN